MKHLIIILSVLVLSTFVRGQQTDDIYYERPKSSNSKEEDNPEEEDYFRGRSYSISTDVNPALNAARIKHVNFCLDRFRIQQYTAMGVSFFGGVFIGLAPTGENDSPFPFYVGGALSLAGLGLYIDSYKWLRRTSIEPSRDGLTFRFNF